jgi:hypothetical protein
MGTVPELGFPHVTGGTLLAPHVRRGHLLSRSISRLQVLPGLLTALATAGDAEHRQHHGARARHGVATRHGSSPDNFKRLLLPLTISPKRTHSTTNAQVHDCNSMMFPSGSVT